MITRDLVALKAYDTTLELYSNVYSSWFDRIEYYNDADKEVIHTEVIKDSRAIINGLTEGYYTFYGVNDNGEKSRALKLYFEERDNLTAFLSSFNDDQKTVLIKYIAEMNYPNLVSAIYNLLNNTEDEYEYGILKDALYKAIEQSNNEQLILNRQLDSFRIYLSSKHILTAVSTDDAEFTSDMYVKIEDIGVDAPNELVVKISEPTFSRRMADGLYRIEFYQKDRLVFELYFYANSADSYEKYEDILASLEEKKARSLSSISILPSDLVFSNLEEEKILVNLYGFNDEKALFARPRLKYIDGLIEVSLPEDALSFFHIAEMHQYFLCAVEEEELYKKKITPIRIELAENQLVFNPWKYMFKEKPYYFFIADENDKIISETTYLDLSDEQEADEDDEDINNILRKITWGRFTKNLYNIVDEEKPELWPTIKNTLDAAGCADDTGYRKPLKVMLEKVLETWNERFGNITWVILYLYLSEHKYFMRKNRQFMKNQYRSDYYRTHIVPAGDYIFSVTRINKGEIKQEFYYDPDNTQSIRFDVDEFIIFYCINPDDYSVSDFGFYNNTPYGTSYRYNSLNVEKVE